MNLKLAIWLCGLRALFFCIYFFMFIATMFCIIFIM